MALPRHLRSWISMFVVVLLVGGFLHHATRTVAAEGVPTVTTGKDDYFANEVVDMYGSGFTAGDSYEVVVVRPDGSAVLYASSESGIHGEQQCYDADASDGTSCSQSVIADDAGAWTNLYQLNGVSGEYRINVLDGAGSLVATQTFLDAASLAFTGADGAPHLLASSAEDLGTVAQTVPLALTCPRGNGLTFQGANFGSTETIPWTIGYFSGISDDAAILSPLTTFAPASGTISGASPSACIAPTIATSSLTVGETYYGILRVVTSEAGGRSRDVKYHFVFTVGPPPPPQCIVTSYTANWKQPIDPATNTLNSQVVNTTKLGRVVPLKVTLTDNCGNVIDDTSGKDVSVRVYETTTPGSSQMDGVEQYADAGSANNNTICFRWAGEFWLYNLDTSNKGNFGALQLNKTYKVEAGVVDDTTAGCDVGGRILADPDAFLKMMR